MFRKEGHFSSNLCRSFVLFSILKLTFVFAPNQNVMMGEKNEGEKMKGKKNHLVMK